MTVEVFCWCGVFTNRFRATASELLSVVATAAVVEKRLDFCIKIFSVVRLLV